MKKAQKRLTHFSKPNKLKELVKASQIRAKLFDKKFDDINANLWSHKQLGYQVAYQYNITKDFIAEYPTLSKSDIDLLEKADQKALTNLSLYVGMFKPSLSKAGKDAKSEIMKRFKERQDFLDTYGGVTAINGSTEYAENNEVKCKISSVPQHIYDSIVGNIERDWDKKHHSGMKYKVKGVYQVTDLAVESEFNDIKKENAKVKSNLRGHHKNTVSDIFYHGTGAMATSLILGHSGEFKVGKAKVGRMLGNGIYLADKSSKSAQYISDKGYSRSGIRGSLMVVEASLGSMTTRANRANWDKYDTVYADTSTGLLNNEWCVHNPKAVIPRYLVEMEIM